MRKDKKLYSKMVRKYSEYSINQVQEKIEKEMVELREEYPKIYKYMENFKLKR